MSPVNWERREDSSQQRELLPLRAVGEDHKNHQRAAKGSQDRKQPEAGSEYPSEHKQEGSDLHQEWEVALETHQPIHAQDSFLRIPLSLLWISSHRCERLWSSLHRCEWLWSSLHRCERLWSSLHRCERLWSLHSGSDPLLLL